MRVVKMCCCAEPSLDAGRSPDSNEKVVIVNKAAVGGLEYFTWNLLIRVRPVISTLCDLLLDGIVQ